MQNIDEVLNSKFDITRIAILSTITMPKRLGPPLIYNGEELVKVMQRTRNTIKQLEESYAKLNALKPIEE